MLETEIIQQMIDGTLPSPYMLEVPGIDNSMYIKVRITGTGDIERHGQKTYRNPSYYLNDEFLQRCLGLPLIVEHPDGGAVINPAEDQQVGTIIHSYIPEGTDEVWGIGRILHYDTALSLLNQDLSTSPSVLAQQDVIHEDGSLEEGMPIRIDHLAIVPHGVWDRGGPPTGIIQEEPATLSIPDATTEETNEMTTEEMLAALKGHIAECVDSAIAPIKEQVACLTKKDEDPGLLHERERVGELRELEKKRDSEAEEERKDDELSALKRDLAERDERLRRLEDSMAAQKKVDEDLPADELRALADAQHAASEVFQKLEGRAAPAPMIGERATNYRRRLLSLIQNHSDSFKGEKLDGLEGVSLKVVEERIYSDAVAKATAAKAPKTRGYFGAAAPSHIVKH